MQSAEPAPTTALGRKLWGDVYTISYRLAGDPTESGDTAATTTAAAVAGASTTEARVGAHDSDRLESQLSSVLPAVLPPSEPASTVLQLLSFLVLLNERWRCLFAPAFAARLRVGSHA